VDGEQLVKALAKERLGWRERGRHAIGLET
jgi:hypothetical protein